jgi:hypothetical protein
MELGEVVRNTWGSMQVRMVNATFNYTPNQSKMASNRTKAIIGGVVAAAAYALDYNLIAAGSLAYSAVKSYQAVRDWAGK